MGVVRAEGIRTYAYHGCMPEEAAIGTLFETTIEVTADLTKAAEEDNLSATIDYVVLGQIVKEEMAKRAYLIEHVAHRIIQRCKSEWPWSEKVRVEVKKFNPPMNAEVAHVATILES